MKKKLVTTPAIVAPNWGQEFELICDASNYAIGEILRQKRNGRLQAIYYASKVLNGAQINYTTMEKEMLAVVYALEKFRSYLVGSKIIVHIDHSAIKYILTKADSKPRLNDEAAKKENEIEEEFPNETLMIVSFKVEDYPWFADMANLKAMGQPPKGMIFHERKRFFREVTGYVCILFRIGANNLLR